MIGKTFALVQRALRVESRGITSHLFRGALAGIILFLLATLFESFMLSAPGLSFFFRISMLNFVFITLAGATIFATSITEEKEQRTLGLLKMANVPAVSILFGKWLPRLIAALMLLAVQVPFTWLAVTMGGVLWDQVAAVFLALAAHLVLMGCLGLFCSTICARSGMACGLAIVILLIWAFVPGLLMSLVWILVPTLNNSTALLTSGHLTDELSNLPAWQSWPLWLIWELSAWASNMWGLTTIIQTLEISFDGTLIGFQFISNLLVAAFLFGASWFLFGRFAVDAEESARPSILERLRRKSARTSGARPWDQAIAWKEFQFLGGGIIVALLKLLGYGSVIFVSVWLYDLSWHRLDFEVISAYAIVWSLFFIALETAILSTRLFRNEIMESTWSTLCMLPKSIGELVLEKISGGIIVLLPALSWLVVGALAAPDNVAEFFGEVFEHGYVFMLVTYMVTEVAFAIVLATWISVAARWGIWPVAVFLSGFTIVMLNMLLLSCLIGSGDETGFFVFTCLVSFGSSAALIAAINQTLIARAGDS